MTKRSRTPHPPSSSSTRQRKRVRIGRDDLDAETEIKLPSSSAARGGKGAGQNTLTQLAFVGSPSSRAVGDEARDSGSRRRTRRSMGTRPRAELRKRDSTLTQMDFFTGQDRLDVDAGFEGVMLDVHAVGIDVDASEGGVAHVDGVLSVDAKAVNAQVDGAAARVDTVPQLDGTMDLEEPVVSVQQRSAARQRKEATRDAITMSEIGMDRPAKRRKTDQSVSETNLRRRPGSRTTASVSDVKHSTAPDPTARRVTAASAPARRPLLEIQDSTEFVDATATQVDRFFNSHVRAPSTPCATRTSIPSSQSPESLPPMTRQTRSVTRQSARKPLADISTNLPVSPNKAVSTNNTKTAEEYTSPSKMRLPTLKVREKPIVPPRQRTNNSQQDIRSLRPNPSPRPTPSPKKEPPETNTHGLPSITRDSSVVSITIPETDGIASSQNNNVLNARDINYHARKTSSQQRMPPPRVDRPISGQTGHSSLEDTAVVEDLDADMIHFPGDVVDEGLEQTRACPDDVSDFGSPVKNDTQFVQTLFQRISSPPPPPSSSSGGLPATKNRSLEEQPPSSASKLSSEVSHVTVPTQILPTPRLVRTSPQQPLARQTASMSFINLPSADTSFERVRVTNIPLNDTVVEQQTSSDPLLPPPPAAKTTQTQRGIYPASIPHPSQVSTQISTQGYFPTAFGQQTQHSIFAAAVPEQIVIGNSSSVPARLDRVSAEQTTRETQESALNVQLVDGSDEFDDDLNPASMRPYRSNTKRKFDAADLEQNVQDIVDDDVEDVTQTPTQTSRMKNLSAIDIRITSSSSQASILVTNATTKSQRDAKLEIVYLTSSSPPARSRKVQTASAKSRRRRETSQKQSRTVRRASTRDTARNRSVTTTATTNNRSPSPSHFRTRQARPEVLQKGKDPVQFDFSSTQEKSSDTEEEKEIEEQDKATPRPSHPKPPAPSTQSPTDLPCPSSPLTPSPPRPLQRKYDALPGFDNDTQSDLTQHGHVTAAYIHRQREKGVIPAWFVPRPFRVGAFEEVD